MSTESVYTNIFIPLHSNDKMSKTMQEESDKNKETNEPSEPSRRDILKWLWLGAGALALGGSALAAISPSPSRAYAFVATSPR